MITLLLIGCIYFFPTLVAIHRGHRITGILLLNFFFGWTGIGWLAMLLWAVISRPCPCIEMPPMYAGYSGWYR